MADLVTLMRYGWVVCPQRESMRNIQGIDHVGIRVMNLETSLEFYQKLGFHVERSDSQEQVYVVRHACGIEINLIANGQDDCQQQNVLMDIAPKYPGYTHYAIRVESIEEVIHFLEEHNIPLSGGPERFGDGKTSIFIRDPDHNVIEFTQVP